MVWLAVRRRAMHLIVLAALVSMVALAMRPATALTVATVSDTPFFQAATWPVSDGLLVSEVVTGAASASDEFVEIYNAAPTTRSLADLELVYITASGSTVTRKQAWTDLTLESGRHLLLANSAGQWAASADGLYTSGFAATGGTLALRTTEGVVIDSLSWGEAASIFVEGLPGSAPPAGSSLERLPGAAAGNASDTNDNLADTRIEPNPVAQSLTAPAIPVATPSPAADPACVIDEGGPLATPLPGVTSTIAEARAMPLGSAVSVAGRLTAPAGMLDGGQTSFIEDGSAGIAVRVTAGGWPEAAAGTDVMATGVIESLYGQLTIVLPSSSQLTLPGTSGPLPEPPLIATGLACEPLEGRLMAVEAYIITPLVPAVDGFVALIDDGSGPLELVVPAASEIEKGQLVIGSLVSLTGVLGQHDELGDGAAGYRLILRSADDIVMLAPPPPTATPTASPIPSSTPSPSPSPSPSPDHQSVPVAVARQQPVGSTVTVRGVVTVTPGWILGDDIVGLQDATAGIFVELPGIVPSAIGPGREIEATGVLAAPYGNLELRAIEGGITVLEMLSQPSPRLLVMAALNETTEGLLARIEVTVERIDSSSSGSLTLIVHDESGDGRVFFHASLGATASDFSVGERLAVVGLVGDRLGLYRLWPRNQSDVATIAAAPTASPRPTPTPRKTTNPRPSATRTPVASRSPSPNSGPVVTIADALRRQGQTVTVEGVVTVRTGLLDSAGERVTIQDASGAILVRLPGGADGVQGRRLRVTGEVGTYYGAPQLTASNVEVAGSGATTPTSVRSAPISRALEWRLVTVTGQIESVRRDGDAWRAELVMPGGGVPIVGLERSGIPSTALAAGRGATVTGIVKRAYPTATDQRLAIVPRTAADIDLGPLGANSSASADDDEPRGASAGAAETLPGAPSGPSVGPSGAGPRGDVALGEIAAHEGGLVAIGGKVVAIDGPSFTIEDGTSTAFVRLVGPAASLTAQIAVGDLVNARGRVVRTATAGLHIVVDDPLDIALLGATSIASALASNGVSTGTSRKDLLVSRDAVGATSRPSPVLVLAAIGLAAAATLALVVAIHPLGRRRLRLALGPLVARLRG